MMEPAAAAAQSSRPSRLRDLAAACAPFPHGFYSAAVATQLCQQCSLWDGGASSAAFRTVPAEDGCALCELRWWDEGEVQKWLRLRLLSALGNVGNLPPLPPGCAHCAIAGREEPEPKRHLRSSTPVETSMHAEPAYGGFSVQI